MVLSKGAAENILWAVYAADVLTREQEHFLFG